MQTLRMHLADMCRVSQRCVDDSVKALQLGSPDMIASVRDNAYEINLLHSDTAGIARELLLSENVVQERDLRFVLSSIRVCDALHMIHNNTLEMASNTMRLWGNGGSLALTDFPQAGDLVSNLVNSCSAALIKEEIEPAQMVLQGDRFDRDFVRTFYDWYRTLDYAERTQAPYALSIARQFCEIVRHAREMAEAIVFWLDDDMDGAWPSSHTAEVNVLDLLTEESIMAVQTTMSGRL